MTKIDIISGFLGAGKTTLIKKLLAEAYQGEKLVLIENEFGEVSIDGGFLKESGVQISEMSSGCICCSLVGDFHEALKQVQADYHPDRILIEPSGVGALSDVIKAVKETVEGSGEMALNSAVTVADASKVKVYMKNFGEFYNDQVAHAGAILLSRTQKLTQEKLEAAVALLREKNEKAAILTTPWDELDGKTILSAMEGTSLAQELMAEMEHHHHDHDEDCDCACHGHHHHEHDHEHEHHHDHDHEHGEDCDCGCHDQHHHEHEHEHHHDHDHEHHHDHEHGKDCECGCHDHHGHNHHHHADEVFSSWGRETPKTYTQADIEGILTALDTGAYGKVLRAKGIVPTGDGAWLEFDYVPEEYDVRPGKADYTGRLCVIGAELKEADLSVLFGL